jgi:hypothetical protein
VSNEVRRKEGLLTTQEFEQLNPEAVIPVPEPVCIPLQQPPSEPSVASSPFSATATLRQQQQQHPCSDAPTEVRIKEGLLTPVEFELRNPDAVYVQPQAVTSVAEEPPATPSSSQSQIQMQRSSVSLPPLVPSFHTKIPNTLESNTTSHTTIVNGVPSIVPSHPVSSAGFPNGPVTPNESKCCVIL